jgi:hypothetical protein
MKKYRFAIVVLTLGLAGLLVVLRARGVVDADRAEGEQARPAAAAGSVVAQAQHGMGRRAIDRGAHLTFSPAQLTLPASAPDEPPVPSSADRVKEPYYDKLMLSQGRDQAKEEQLLTKLTAAFGDSPDTLIGAVACSPQFCRVELRAVGEINVHDRWQRELFAAVEPKGLKFLLVDSDEDGNTMASCYFGRDESWTVPDFRALGML